MSALVVAGDVSGTCTLQAPSAAGSTVLTLPVIATDTLAGIAATQTLTNKTLVAPALGTPASGVLTNCTGVVAAALPAGSVLQVVSAYYHTNQSTTSTSFVATNLTASITPRSTSSKILIIVNLASFFNTVANGTGYWTIYRNSANIAPLGSGNAANFGTIYNTSGVVLSNSGGAYLDSPATTASTTYTAYFSSGSGTAVQINGNAGNSNITLMEIQG